jgi:hypothetical protein
MLGKKETQMTNLKPRKTRSKIRAVANSMGAIAVFERSSKHNRVTLSKNGVTRFVMYACTSRSTSGLRNTIARAPRTVDGM